MGNYAGLVITGVAGENERAGFSVSGIGDINGDGIDDIAITAPRADLYVPEEERTYSNAGAVYVVFGQNDESFPPEINLEDLDGTDGFKITPQANLTDSLYGYGQSFGSDVQGLGDVNGDGIDDFGIVHRRSDNVGGFYYEGGGSGDGSEGIVYVVYGGQQPYNATEDINGLGGFRIDATGYVEDIVALGDVNGDGINDVGVNAVESRTGTATVTTYVLYDVNGNGEYDQDVDGEYLSFYDNDVLVGQTKAFVVFGTSDERVSEDPIANPENDGGGGFYGEFLAATANPAGQTIGETIVNTELLDGSDGFTIITGTTASAGYFGYYGEYGGNIYGRSDPSGGLAAMGDFNGDGIADMIVEENGYFVDPLIGIRSPDGQNDFMNNAYIGNSTSGQFIIFGQDGGPDVAEISVEVFPTADEIDYRVFRFATFDESRAALGDVSGDDGLGEIGYAESAGGTFAPIDGFDGIVLGVAVINGTDAAPFSETDFATTDPKARTLTIQDVIDGQGALYYDSTSFLSASTVGLVGGGVRGVGDVNGDGTADFVIGGSNFGELEENDTESVLFLVFGSQDAVTGMIDLNDLVVSGDAYRFTAGTDNDDFGSDVAAAGDLNGDGLADIIIGNEDADGAGFADGEAVVIFGGGLEAADNADGSDDNQIALSNLNVNIDTGERPTEIRFEDGGFFVNSVTEGDATSQTISFEIRRDGDLTDTVTVDYAVSGDGFAPADATDFVGGVFPSGTVTFDSGSATATLDIEIAGDFVVEPTERFEINLSNPTTDSGNEVFISGGTTFGQIVDNDTPAQVWVSWGTGAREDADPATASGGISFAIRRTGDFDGEVTVNFVVEEASSSAAFNAGPEDFLGYMLPDGTIVEFGQTSSFPLTGQMTIPDGSSFETIKILPQPDLDIENTERFEFRITDLATTGDKGVEVLNGRDTGFGSIINDDFNPGVFVFASSDIEGTNLPDNALREIVYSFEKQGAIDDAVTITYRLTGVETIPQFRQFGADEDDFVDVDLSGDLQTITIPVGTGNTVELRLPINPDAQIEPTERVELEIVSIDGRAGVDYNVNQTLITGSIFNDDGRPAIPTIPFDVDGDGVIEDGEEIPVEADVFGDPHITTLDGLGYDFQAVGEYVLVETLAGATNDFSVHVRFEPFPGSDVVSVTTRMSVEVAGAVVEIDALGANPVLIDGVPPTETQLAIGGIDIDGDGQFDVEINGGEFTVYLNNLDDGSAEQLKIGIFDGSLNVCVFLGDPAQGGNAGAVRGLMGNANGDLSDDYALRDGSTIPAESLSTDAEGTPQLTFDYLYGAYAESWEITEGERVFTDDAPDFPDNFPAASFTLDDLPAAVVAAATQAALDAGLSPDDNEVIFENAVLDFALTGSDAFFDSAQVLVAEPEAASDPTDTPEVPATVGVTAVSSEITEGDTGSQSVTFTFYRIGDVEGALDVDYTVGGDIDAADLVSGTALSGTVSFADSEDTKSITLDVAGDLTNETDEDLKVMITGTSEAGTLIAASQGITTVLTDDFAPVAVDDTFSTNEDTRVSGDLFLPNPAGGDTDGDGDPFTVVRVNGAAGEADGNRIILPSGAFLFVNADGTFDYDPFGFSDPDDTDLDQLGEGVLGRDSFTYAISDGNGGESEATVSINVTGINDAPEAVIDEFVVDENGTVSGNVLTGENSITGPDSDPEGDDLTVVSIGGQSLADADEDAGTAGTQVTFGDGGTVTIFADGEISYDTNGEFEQLGDELVSRLQSIQIEVADTSGLTDGSALRFSVRGTNDAPVGGDDTSSTLENQAVEISLFTLLSNDSDVDSSTLTITAVSDAGNGATTLNAETITYQPEEGFSGDDTFTYTLSDGHGGETEVTVTVTVSDAPNVAPVATDDTASTNEDNAVDINVLENDEDVDMDDLEITGTSDASNGSISVDGGIITYTPDDDFAGEDSFTYVISDGNGGSDSATVTVTVNAVNDDPDAVEDSATTDEDVAVDIDVLFNDTDVEMDQLSITGLGDPSDGEVEIVNGQIRYTPNDGFSGEDSFTYTIGDGNGGSDTATVSVSVGAVNDAPTANEDSAEVDEDGSVLIDVLDNDSDPEGTTLVISDLGDASSGSVVIEDGQIRYTPDANVNGSDSFTYTVSDGFLTDEATVTVTINAVNDGPVAADDSASTDEDTALTGINVLGNDTDLDDTELVVTGFDATGTVGTVTLNDDGTFDYDPSGAFEALNDGESEVVSFTYTVSDGEATDTGTVEITINGVTDVAEPLVIEGSDATAPEILRGTGADEIIVSNAGAFDRMIGGGGADCFVFGDETSNGVFERDFILDFEVGVDKLDFGGADYNITATSRFAVVSLGTDGDQLTLIGSGLSEAAIENSIVDDTIA